MDSGELIMVKLSQALSRKQWFALALTAQLTATPLLASAAAYQDVNGHWAQTAIMQLGNQNILGGYPDGSFRPQNPITRAEFAAILAKALRLDTSAVSRSQTFHDVSTNHWAFPVIQAVYQRGLVNGYPGQLFMPGNNIRRAEAMAILSNVLGGQIPPPNTIDATLQRYPDQSTVPTWARAAVAKSVQAGLLQTIPNSDRSLDAMSLATRAEVATMVNNLLATSASGGVAQNPYSNGNTANANANATANPNAPDNGVGNYLQVDSRATLSGRVITIPQSTVFTGTLASAISSELNNVGDPVVVRLDKGLTATNGQQVIPAGSEVRGRITQIEQAGRAGKAGTMAITFDQIVLNTGERVAIEGQVNAQGGVLRGDTGAGRILKAAGKTAVGAGLGAALGTAMGPLSGGKVGRGAVYGTAIGAGVGALKAATDKGPEVVVTSGDQLEIKLTSPISLEERQGS
jgi:hypothetical protein